MQPTAIRAGMGVAVLVLAAPLAAQAPAHRLPGNVVDVAAHDFHFTAPDSIPAGLTTFQLKQAGTAVISCGSSNSNRAARFESSPKP